MSRFISQLIVIVFATFFIFGCKASSEPDNTKVVEVKVSDAEIQTAYQNVIDQNTMEGYISFLKMYPYSDKISEIKEKCNLLDTVKRDETFKVLQLRNKNPKQAFAEKEEEMIKLVESNGIDYNSLEMLFVVIKSEQILEAWARDRRANTKFQLLKTYNLCVTKNTDTLRKTDLLVPESFYYIKKYHPGDPYFVRMEINFPNPADKIRGRTGGDVAIHGGCFSTYCTPLTDSDIKELFVLAVEAKAKGQKQVPVYNFPGRMDDKNYLVLTSIPRYASDELRLKLWASMKPIYDYFETNRTLPKIGFDKQGLYTIEN